MEYPNENDKITRPKSTYNLYKLKLCFILIIKTSNIKKMESKSFPPSQSSLGFFGIIRESFKTTSRNGKLLVPILLLVFLLLSQLEFAQNYILSPVVQDLVLQLAEHPNMVQEIVHDSVEPAIYVGGEPPYYGAINDIREVLLVKLLIYVVYAIIMLLFVVATVSSSYEAYTAKVLGTKDVFLKIKDSWKRPLVTSFYMVLLTSGFIFLYTFFFVIASILAVNYWVVLLSFGVLAISIPICYFYLAALWMVSVVVSILEEGVSGVKAIGRGAEIMKGKKIQALLIMVLFAIGYAVVHLTANSLMSYNMSITTVMAIRIPFKNGFFCLLKLFMFVVFTVFYHERKTSHDEKEGKGLYLPIIASGEV